MTRGRAEVAEPFPDTAEIQDGRLRTLGGIAVEELAERFGTPLWLVDRATLEGRMRAYREAFAAQEAVLGATTTVVYAAKALCVRGVLELADDCGLWVDCASGGELATARAAGIDPRRIVLHGNNKSVAELRDAVDAGVGRIVIDSLSELARLEGIAEAAGRVVPCHLRVTPGVDAHTHEFVATGHDDTKFGLTLSLGLAHEGAARLVASRWLDLVGVHCHVGSDILRLDPYHAAADVMVRFLAEVRATHGAEVGELNLGGGLGISAVPGDVPPELPTYAADLTAAVAEAADAHGLTARPHLFVEPGRSIAGPAGVTLYRVGTIKELPGLSTYVAVDGGMSDNPRYPLYQAPHTFAPAGAVARDGTPRPVTVVGKHCETGDVLGEGVSLPSDLAEGDLLAVAATGAYNHAMASNYNRLPRPAMVLVGEGWAVELVRRETVEDLLAREPSLRDARPPVPRP
ncbi:diaminopimelate decarboxylase [Egibacter rhizosphaerae]|uniref:diaminopimelate decarboxylase n=1 Tax=Egibacter rhizosphaerae TaxID=1670831 RepID=UPI0013F14794|nr:diaminopimelate decarboxylase [Egibacter rhizosphaerae]